MRSALLMCLLCMAALISGCTNGNSTLNSEEKSSSTGSEGESESQESLAKLAVSPNTKAAPVAFANNGSTPAVGQSKTDSIEEELNKIKFEAEGHWTAADSREFYRRCNLYQNDKTKNVRLNLDRYCDCVKGVMLDTGYQPDQLRSVAKKEGARVQSCLMQNLATN